MHVQNEECVEIKEVKGEWFGINCEMKYGFVVSMAIPFILYLNKVMKEYKDGLTRKGV